MKPGQFPLVQGKRGRGGKRADLDNRYFRSRWEANWARYLNWLKGLGEIQSWDFESKTFEFVAVKRGGRFYTPDFFVINRDGSEEYHEVKGWMDPRSATKLRRMGEYFPAVKIVLIDQAAYKATARQMSGLLPGWETERVSRATQIAIGAGVELK